jgi:hypothetical protein
VLGRLEPLRALSVSDPAATLRLAKVVYRVNCVTLSAGSNTPSTRQASSLLRASRRARHGLVEDQPGCRCGDSRGPIVMFTTTQAPS